MGYVRLRRKSNVQTIAPIGKGNQQCKKATLPYMRSVYLFDSDFDFIACVHISEKIKLGSDVDRFR